MQINQNQQTRNIVREIDTSKKETIIIKEPPEGIYQGLYLPEDGELIEEKIIKYPAKAKEGIQSVKCNGSPVLFEGCEFEDIKITNWKKLAKVTEQQQPPLPDGTELPPIKIVSYEESEEIIEIKTGIKAGRGSSKVLCEGKPLLRCTDQITTNDGEEIPLDTCSPDVIDNNF